jgi:hypothetical protein
MSKIIMLGVEMHPSADGCRTADEVVPTIGCAPPTVVVSGNCEDEVVSYVGCAPPTDVVSVYCTDVEVNRARSVNKTNNA